MQRTDPNDLKPPLHKVRRAVRPLSMGEIKAAADRAEARALQTRLTKPAKPPPMAGRNPEVLQLRE